MDTITTCPQGHQIRTTADRDTQGYCRRCRREGKRLRDLQNRAALDVVRVFEAAGVRFENDGVPIDAADVARQLVAVYAAV